ncbi:MULTISPECIES: metallophosphoesterase [unclassified Methylobacterium]|uniref:metallophosphoesterase n=2 Tax=Methylobacterium TaxID=407 RepID=UPI001FEE5FBA|nr:MULTISPECIES: metallophosphoesterase [unclassified Methylobacterium]
MDRAMTRLISTSPPRGPDHRPSQLAAIGGLAADDSDPSTATAAVPVMRLQLLSDLHVDLADTGRLQLVPGADLVVVAGDTCQGAVAAFAYLRQHIPAPIPIVMVMGNHEYYGAVLQDELARARAAAQSFDITLLENDAVVIGGVRILGCTLWTNYRLFGAGHRPVAMAAARRVMNDHRRIAGAHLPAWQPFLPADAADLHAGSVRFIADTLAMPHDGPSIVVTHHAPHPEGIAPRFGRDPVSAAFASDLSDLIAAGGPELWLSGHTHHPINLMIGRTRLVSNPHGYGDECKAFDPALVIEIPITRSKENRP